MYIIAGEIKIWIGDRTQNSHELQSSLGVGTSHSNLKVYQPRDSITSMELPSSADHQLPGGWFSAEIIDQLVGSFRKGRLCEKYP